MIKHLIPTLTALRKVANFSWQAGLKSRHTLGRQLIRLVALGNRRLTRSWILVIFGIARQYVRYYRTQGSKGLANRLKVQNLLLRQWVADQTPAGANLSWEPRGNRGSSVGAVPEAVSQPVLSGDASKEAEGWRLDAANRLKAKSPFLSRTLNPRELGVAVARTRTGCPRDIPSLHREMMKRGDRRVIRIWLSIFGLYRVIEFPGKVKLSTITQPYRLPTGVRENLRAFGPDFYKRLITFCGVGEPIRPSTLEPEPFILLKSSPTVDRRLKTAETSIGTLFEALSFWKASEELPFLIEWLTLTKSYRWLQALEEGLALVPKVKGSLGRLGYKEEPGKVRVFAMVDYLTQLIMSPLHSALFAILGKIPQDGTFEQQRPLKLLLKRSVGPYYSFDLSAATDRLPILVQSDLLSGLIGDRLAFLWCRLLIDREYRVPPRRGEVLPESVRYVVGQPMGALSSWAMLALTHHFIVQYAAAKAGYRKWFRDYAVLGDDIVLANHAVAMGYLRIMRRLGVEVNLSKSIRSRGATLEFAKRFVVGGIDSSPISAQAFQCAQGNLGVLEAVLREASHLVGLHLGSVARAFGFGMKTQSRADNPWSASSRFQGLFVFLSRVSGLLGVSTWSEWFTLGRPGSPVPRAAVQSVWDAKRDRLDKAVTQREKALGDATYALMDRFGGSPWSAYSSPEWIFFERWFYSPIYSRIERLWREAGNALYSLPTATLPDEGVMDLVMKRIGELDDLLARCISDPNLLVRGKKRVEKQSSLLRMWRRVRSIVDSQGSAQGSK